MKVSVLLQWFRNSGTSHRTDYILERLMLCRQEIPDINLRIDLIQQLYSDLDLVLQIIIIIIYCIMYHILDDYLISIKYFR